MPIVHDPKTGKFSHTGGGASGIGGVRATKVPVSTAPYERSHGAKPRGRGNWMFQGSTHRSGLEHELQGAPKSFFGTHGEASKAAATHFAAQGHAYAVTLG